VIAEDTEYCHRLLRLKEKIMYAPRAIVYHPVEEYRLDKKYLEAWSFHRGRSFVRIDGVPENATCYFDVPRYLLPPALKYFLLWISSLTSKRRFYFKLEFCHTLGGIVESRRMVKNRELQENA
jgi:GT2 family glycosyltransferase